VGQRVQGVKRLKGWDQKAQGVGLEDSKGWGQSQKAQGVGSEEVKGVGSEEVLFRTYHIQGVKVNKISTCHVRIITVELHFSGIEHQFHVTSGATWQTRRKNFGELGGERWKFSIVETIVVFVVVVEVVLWVASVMMAVVLILHNIVGPAGCIVTTFVKFPLHNKFVFDR
jgi:hypothetical protein